MTVKIKLTKKQSDFIENALSSGMDKEEILNAFAKRNAFEKHTNHSLHGLCVMDLARALLIGYEIESEFKAGDWVVFTYQDGKVAVGKITKFHPGDNDHAYLDIPLNRDDGLFVNCRLCNLSHATPEEIKDEKERRLWAEIDRPVGKFVIGDIGIAVDDTYTYNPNFIEALYYSRELKGFYPEESFISFEDGGSND